MGWLWQEKKKTPWENAKEFIYENRMWIFGGVVGIAGVFIFHRIAFRRFKDVADVPESFWKKKKTLHGVVSSVGDGDGFHLYHQVGNLIQTHVKTAHIK
jgi:hypothetical protein